MSRWVKIFKEAAMIMLIALAIAGAAYALRPMVFAPGSAGQASGTAEGKVGAVPEMTLQDARDYFEKGSALFADARSLRAFQSGHIKGAMHLDPDEFDAWSGDFFSRIPPDQVIITYCEGARCALSLQLAEKLTWMGYEKVFYMKNGWGVWKENRLPVEGLSK